MTLDAWMYSGEAVRAKTFEELWEQFQPFISKNYIFNGGFSRFAANGIPGMEVEDFTQEAMMVLMRCQRSFSPEAKEGHGGKKSSFMNFLAHALDNRWAKLRASTDKYHRPVMLMICTVCGSKVPPAPRFTCQGVLEDGSPCKNRRWMMERSFLESVDEMLVEPPVDEDDGLSTVNYLLNELPPELVPSVQRLLAGGETKADLRALKLFGQRRDLPPEFMLQKSIRVRE